MKSKKFIFRHPVFTQFLIGLAVLSTVAIVSVRSDMAASQSVLTTTAGYIKEQCNRYARIELAAETKSLMRIVESGKQISHLLSENGSIRSEENLENYARNSYVSGVILLDGDGEIRAEYHADGQMPAQVAEALQSPALLDTAEYPEKRYATRLRCTDGSEIDLAATHRLDENGIVVCYYHTPAEYIEAFKLSVSAMLSGYSVENDGIIAVSEGDTVIASNDASLIGQSTNDIPVLSRIRDASAGEKLMHAGKNDSRTSQYFGIMERGRDVYVFAFLPGRNVFTNTPRTLLYSLIMYLLILLGINTVRWKTEQQAQKEFSARLQGKNEQLSEAIREADRANAAKTSFLSRMSHDIRTPLNGIIGLLEIDAAHPDDLDLITANRGKMQLAADHLLSLINDVLQMSKLESGEVILAHEPIDLNRLSTEVLVIISQRAAESGITMKYDRSSDRLNPRWVYGSPLHLRQIFLNIFTNCIKYNKVGGEISTLFQCVDKTENTVTYRWTISDTGIGMSEEFLRRIFDPFSQEKTDARSIYQGTGLGMTIVKGLVEQMHGTIEAGSKEGVGSTFTVTIPFEIAQPVTEPEIKEISADKADIHGLHLMLAEDNDLNAEIAATLLEDAGAVTTTVGNGQQAVNLFAEKPAGTFDAILMDIMMPVMDGLTATRAIRALDRPDAKTVPIIAMTANAFAEDAERCINAGMNAHLAKPLEIRKVTETIARCVHGAAD